MSKRRKMKNERCREASIVIEKIKNPDKEEKIAPKEEKIKQLCLFDLREE